MVDPQQYYIRSPSIPLLSQCSHLFLCFKTHGSALFRLHLWENLGCIFEKVPWSLVSRCYRMFLPTYSGAQAMKNNHYRLWQMQLQSNKKDAESYSFSLSPHVTPSLNIKHHISLLHSCDGYVWLLSWLHLELSNTQMIRHTCDGWHFFLIKSFDAGRPTSRLDLWGGKIHL